MTTHETLLQSYERLSFLRHKIIADANDYLIDCLAALETAIDKYESYHGVGKHAPTKADVEYMELERRNDMRGDE